MRANHYFRDIKDGMWKSCLLLCLLLIIATHSHASNEANAFNSLKERKVVALMRHAIAPGNGDPSEFTLGDCKTQRNLSSEGIQQAQKIGAQMKSYGITNADVFSSQWCRCIDTATELGIGPAQALPMLNSFYQDRSSSELQTNQLNHWIKDRLDESKPRNQAAILVTHQVNITALTGVYPTSGEIVFIALNNDQLEVVTTVVIPH